MENKEPKVKIQLPNLLMIPIFSIACSIIKLCNGVEWNWISVILIAPFSIYFGWSLFYIIVALLVVLLAKIQRGN